MSEHFSLKNRLNTDRATPPTNRGSPSSNPMRKLQQARDLLQTSPVFFSSRQIIVLCNVETVCPGWEVR